MRPQEAHHHAAPEVESFYSTATNLIRDHVESTQIAPGMWIYINLAQKVPWLVLLLLERTSSAQLIHMGFALL